MNNLGILFRYEWKKIWKKKVVWILGSISIICFLYNDLWFLKAYESVQTDSAGNVQTISHGGYEAYVRECENARKLDGKKIDEKLLGEVWKNYGNEKYAEIEDLLSEIWGRGGITAVVTSADSEQEGDLAAETAKKWYQGLQDAAEDGIKSAVGLTAAEWQYWMAQVDKIEKPLTYTYAKSWTKILLYSGDVSLWSGLLYAVCLSAVFSDERRRKTDLLILSTKNGKNPVFFAKLLAGIAFAELWCVILYGIDILCLFLLYGVEGFSAQIQLSSPYIPSAMTMGQAVLLLLGIAILAALLISILCTVLSEWFGSSIAVMATVCGSVLGSMLIAIPADKRILAQMMDLLPVRLVSIFTLLDYKTVSIFGLRLTDLQFAYVLYPLLAVILMLLGWWKYCRCHAGSR